MKKFGLAVFTLIVLAGLVWLGWLFVRSFLSSPAGVQAGIISFVAAVGVALYTHSATKRRETEARHFVEKRAVYLHFIGFIFKLFEAQKKPGGIKEAELIKEMSKFKQNLLIWGSADVINAYNFFENSSGVLAASQDSTVILKIVEKLYRAIRKDLGHDDKHLPEGELVGLMLNAESKQQFRNSFKNG